MTNVSRCWENTTTRIQPNATVYVQKFHSPPVTIDFPLVGHEALVVWAEQHEPKGSRLKSWNH